MPSTQAGENIPARTHTAWAPNRPRLRMGPALLALALVAPACPQPADPDPTGAATSTTTGPPGTGSSGSSGAGASTTGDSGGSSTTVAPPAVCEGHDFRLGDLCYDVVHPEPAMQIFSKVAAGDFDGDGSVDLATICYAESQSPFFLCVLQQMPDLSWSLSKFDLDPELWSTSAGSLHARDFDANGRPDLFVSEMGAFAVFRFVDGAPTLWTQISSDDPVVTNDVLRMHPAVPVDILGDGTPDILAGALFNGAQVWERTDLQWLPVGDPVTLPSCGDLAGATPIDFDHINGQDVIAIGSHEGCDDHPDEPSTSWNRVTILVALEGSPPTLHRKSTMPAGIASRQTLAGDLDADGWADFGVFDGETVVLYHNRGPDGVHVQPPMTGIFAPTASPALLADLDGDGDAELIGIGPQGLTAVWDPLTSSSSSVLEGVTPDVPGPGAFVLAEDLNDDGLADLVFRESTVSSSPMLLLSASP